LLQRLARALEEQDRSKQLYDAMKRGRDGRASAIQEFDDFEAYRDEIRKIKERCVGRLGDLIDRFVQEAGRRGAHVYLARDGREAISYVMGIVKRIRGKRIIKSKSLTSEEIGFNAPFESEGYEVYETDLGEWIIQVAGEKPVHLVFPAIHKTAGEVAQNFSTKYSEPISPDIEEIMRFVRRTLRKVFLDADIGVSGANVAIAETGSVVIETNEGNGRLVTSIPRVHVVLMGMEKVVERIDDALPLIRAHAVSATGQRTTTYVTVLSGRSPLAGEERELHIVILDNGRSKMLGDEWFKEALYCIRCGACMNICAPYGVATGHLFGHIYPGPIGIPWTANVHGLEKAKFAHLCISCGLCKEICPVEIDIPMMIARVKELDIERHGQLAVNKVLESYESLAPLLSKIAPLWNWLARKSAFRALLEAALGIERSRPLPEFKRETFFKWYKKNYSEGGREEKVVFFVDFFANYVQPELAISVAKILDRAGIGIILPPQKSSGYPYISYGDLRKAREVAEYNVDNLYPYASRGYAIISLEPTATYALKEVYPKLLGGDERSIVVRSATHEVMEYILKLFEDGRIEIRRSRKERVGFHVSCHQRSISAGRYSIELLRRAGLDVILRETGMCCGMGGTFGLKKGPLGHGLSMAIGEHLFRLFREEKIDYIVTESSVCKMHLEKGTGLRVVHPLTILYELICS